MASSELSSHYPGQPSHTDRRRLNRVAISADHAARQWAEDEPRLFREIVRHMPEGMTLTRPSDGVFIYTNPTFAQMLGYDPGELVGARADLMRYRDEQARAALVAAVDAALAADEAWSGDIELLRRDGSAFWCHSTIVGFDHHEHGRLWLSIHEDITDRKRQEDALRESEARFRAIFYEDQSVKLLIDPETGQIVDANEAALHFYGYSYAQLTAMRIHAINVLAPDEVQREIENARAHRRNYFTFRHRLADGAVRDVEVYSTTLTIQQRLYLFSVIHDITERVQAEQALRSAHTLLQTQMSELRDLHDRLRDMAIRDPLTRLYNRRYLHETLPREVARAERGDYYLATLMIDIDHFKHINDTYGHAAGDTVLQAVSHLIMASLRASDIACRYGGEEILCMLLDADVAVATRRAEDLRAAIAQLQVLAAHPAVRVTVSVGVAVFPANGASIGDAILAADSALYRAKDAGRNCVCLA